jgi:hypothetical protein
MSDNKRVPPGFEPFELLLKFARERGIVKEEKEKEQVGKRP